MQIGELYFDHFYIYTLWGGSNRARNKAQAADSGGGVNHGEVTVHVCRESYLCSSNEYFFKNFCRVRKLLVIYELVECLDKNNSFSLFLFFFSF